MRKHLRKISVLLIAVMAVTMIPANVQAAFSTEYSISTNSVAEKGNYPDAGAAEAIETETNGDYSVPEGPDSAYDAPEAVTPVFNGYIEEEPEIDWSQQDGNPSDWGQASYPSSYDMRSKPYGSKIAVKNQSETGLCWAFSATTAAEINYYHKYGANAANKTFSPLQLGYFTYNHVNDPLGLTYGDKNIPTSGKDYKSVGGSNTISMNSLSGWIGFVSESKMPFSNRNQSSYNSNLGYNSNDMIIKNAHMLNYENRNQIKSAIMNYGSVVSNMYIASNFKDYVSYDGVYRYSHKDSNHLVTIIGWNDNKVDSKGNRGAWLVQNSWGSSWNGNGYFWMSYAEPSATSMMSIEVQAESTYDLNYHYDGTACGNSRIMSAGSRAANIYVARNDNNAGTYQVLEAVGLTTYNGGNSTYRIDIYTGCSSTNPVSGTRAATFTASTNTAGYYTFTLPAPVELTDGQRYSIVITFNQETRLATEEPSQTSGTYSSIKYSPSIKTGQSFWAAAGRNNFNDFAKLSNGCTARIKGLVSEEKARVMGTDYDRFRYDGEDRVQTAALINNTRRLAVSDTYKWNTTIVAYGLNFPDALAGSYLSKVNGNAPIMLVYNVYENAMVTYLTNTVKYGGKIYILGGTSVISPQFEQNLRNKGFNVERLAGNNRYETNLAILREAGVSNQELMVCSGNGYADSLSASAAGRPILLVDKTLSASQQNYLNSISSKKAYLVGGTGAVNGTIESQLRSRGYTIQRFAGANRYQTSAMVAQNFFGSSPKQIVLAYGLNFPDGLSGGPLALAVNAPLILADSNKANAGYAKSYVSKVAGLKYVHVLGGDKLVTDSVIQYICR